MNHLVVFLHGIGSSKSEWEKPNDYTHGKDLLDRVSAAGWASRCYDLYGHGDWSADEPDFSPDYINDDLWPKFIHESEEVILKTIEQEVAALNIGQLTLVSYSGAAILNLRIANRVSQDVTVNCIMASPDPAREYDDEYSLHNQINKRPISYLILYGRDDDEINLEDLRFVYDRISDPKAIYELAGGHSIEQSWTGIAFEAMKTGGFRGHFGLC